MSRRLVGIGLLCILFFTGCAVNLHQKKTVEPVSEDSTAASLEEDKNRPDVHYTFLDTLNQGNELQLDDESGDIQAERMKNAGAAASAMSETRFRVQLLASSRIETVREKKKEVEKQIREPIVIGYEAPYYKLYAGDYLKRQEAQALLPKLKRMGFQDAWVVSTRVFPEN